MSNSTTSGWCWRTDARPSSPTAATRTSTSAPSSAGESECRRYDRRRSPNGRHGNSSLEKEGRISIVARFAAGTTTGFPRRAAWKTHPTSGPPVACPRRLASAGTSTVSRGRQRRSPARQGATEEYTFAGQDKPLSLGSRPHFRFVSAPVSPGGHAGRTRLGAGVAAGANTARRRLGGLQGADGQIAVEGLAAPQDEELDGADEAKSGG